MTNTKNNDIEILKHKIEKLRKLLYDKIDIENFEFKDGEIKKISNQLDKLIIDFYRLKNKKSG